MMQVPQAVRMAAFYKGAVLRLAEALADLQKTMRHANDVLLSSVSTRDRSMLSKDVQQRFALLSNVVSAIQTSIHSCVTESF